MKCYADYEQVRHSYHTKQELKQSDLSKIPLHAVWRK